MANLKIDKEKADKFIRDFIEGLKVSETKRKEIFSNTNYLKWLESFTIEHTSFFDVDGIKQHLKDLSNNILELQKKGIPLDALIETLDTTLTEIKKGEKVLQNFKNKKHQV